MIEKFLLSDKNINRSTVFWNAFAAMMNSFQTMLLLLVITRYGNMVDSSTFVMAYAVGNLVLNIGKYGVRRYQVTDISEKYNFDQYVIARKYSCIFMFIATVLYILYGLLCGQYTFEKSFVIFLICFMKGIEAYEDVYHGRMQQKGRLDVAGKILGIRLMCFLIGFTVAYIVTSDLVIACIINVSITGLLAYYLNKSVFCNFYEDALRINKKDAFGILKECFPLCICMCMDMYVANAPKYIIDSVVDEVTQTCFNIIFMPVFIPALLANFIFQPYLKRMGLLWNEKKVSEFMNDILKLIMVVIAVCFVIAIVGGFIGTDVLGIIYGIDLGNYRDLLIIFILVGGVVAIQNLFIMAVTTVRYQKYMIHGYTVVAAFLLILGKTILNKNGILGLSIFYMFMMVLLLIYCMILVIIAMKKCKLKE